MKKGSVDSVIEILGAIIILIFIAYVTWSFIYGTKKTEPEIQTSEKVKEGSADCLVDNDCKKIPDGSICLSISDPQFPERPIKFCSCLKNEDCKSTADVTRGNVCGRDNKCS